MPIEKDDGYRLIKAGISYTTLTNNALEAIKNPIAVAIWVHLCSKPKDWIIRRAEIMQRFDIGRDRYQEAMRELRELGLVWDYHVREEDGNFKDRGVVCSNSLEMVSLKNRPTNGEPEIPKDGKTERRLIRPLSNEILTTNKTKTFTNEIVIPDGINREAWDEWVDCRKKRKNPISQIAANKQLKMLLDYPEVIQAQIIGQSIQNDYKGLFPPKGGTNGQPSQNGFAAGGSGTQNRKLSAVERVNQNIARDRAARQAATQGRDGGDMAPDDEFIRPQVDIGLRGDGGRRERMGGLFEGDCERTD